MALLPEFDQAIVRHTANKIDHIYMAFNINMSIDYGEWYVMKFMIYKGRVRAFVNGNQLYDSNSTYPVAEYQELHIAVRCGIVKFEYVKIFVTA